MSTQQPTTTLAAAEATSPGNGGGMTLQALAPPAPALAPVAVFDADDPVSLYMNPGIFAQLQRVGRMLALSAFVPDAFKGENRTGDCALVAAQAFRWRMDPAAVIQHTFVHKGKVGYEGKLIAAVVNASPRIERQLDYAYEGEEGKPSRKVTVTGRLRGESKDRKIEGTVGAWATDNEKWRSMPDQMLAYRGARDWARRHLPGVLLGVQTDDEVEDIARREAIPLKRSPDGSFEALGALTARLQAVPPATAEPTVTAQPPEPDPAPQRQREPGDDDDTPGPRSCPDDHDAHLARAARDGKTVVCAGCGEEFLAPAKAATKKAPEPEPDPNTPEGNPFLRGARNKTSGGR